MLKKYTKSLGLILTVFAFFALSVFAVSADYNNNNNQNNFNDHHYICYNYSCIKVNGQGQDQCNDDHDCAPQQHYSCVSNSCQKVNGSGQDSCHHDSDCRGSNPSPTLACSPTPTPTTQVSPTLTPTPSIDPCANGQCVTPTVTPMPTSAPSNPGGPGDGRSDGRSDGLSSCPSCTQAPQGQVLGASTGPAVLGLSTTSGEENYLLQFAQLFGALTSAGFGFTFFKKNS